MTPALFANSDKIGWGTVQGSKLSVIVARSWPGSSLPPNVSEICFWDSLVTTRRDRKGKQNFPAEVKDCKAKNAGKKKMKSTSTRQKSKPNHSTQKLKKHNESFRVTGTVITVIFPQKLFSSMTSCDAETPAWKMFTPGWAWMPLIDITHSKYRGRDTKRIIETDTRWPCASVAMIQRSRAEEDVELEKPPADTNTASHNGSGKRKKTGSCLLFVCQKSAIDYFCVFVLWPNVHLNSDKYLKCFISDHSPCKYNGSIQNISLQSQTRKLKRLPDSNK